MSWISILLLKAIMNYYRDAAISDKTIFLYMQNYALDECHA